MRDHEIREISGGWTGTDETVRAIEELVRESLTDPLVVSEARDIVRFVPERDRDAELRAVSAYVRSKIRYTSETVETLATPHRMVEEIRKYGRTTGDCDEAVTLWLAFLRILGHRVRVRVVSQIPDGRANHIFGETFSASRGSWITDDTIVKKRPLGWSIPKEQIT